MKRLILGLFSIVLASPIATNHAFGQAVVNGVYHFDEFGHGNITLNGADQGTFNSTMAPDPSGGLANWNVLIYSLPFAGMQGDVLVQDPAIDGSPILDVLRFTGTGQLIVYSDDLNGIQAPADTPGPPNPFSANLLFVDKQHPSPILGYADWTPLVGEPGYDISNPSYDFLDPGVVPEPGTAALFLGGLGILFMTQRLRRPGARI